MTEKEEEMLTTLTLRLVSIWFAAGDVLRRRRVQFSREHERGDENITKALFAALGFAMATLIAGAITAFVNGKLPLIGGH